MSRRAAIIGAICVAAGFIGGCSSLPPEEDPTQIKLNDLDKRLTRVDRVMANQSLLDLANQVEALRSEVRAMHNDVDVINHSLDSLRKQQHDLFGDLDQRLKTGEGRSSAAAAGQSVNVGASSADAPDKAAYQAGFDLLKAGQYDRAIASFQAFLTSYPKSQLADNAQYWMGEAYYVSRSFPEALLAFQHVVDGYPESRKLPDAWLKLGYCDYELKQFAAARDALSQVLNRFPESGAARLAQQRLDKMAAEKH